MRDKTCEFSERQSDRRPLRPVDACRVPEHSHALMHEEPSLDERGNSWHALGELPWPIATLTTLEAYVSRQPLQRKGDRYHHGDLRAALIDAAIELIGERGVRDFSLAEVSRRLGVAVSAPYAHFADRDRLLAAVAAHAWQLLAVELVAGTDLLHDPTVRLMAMARAYVRFAAAHRALFELLYTATLDKRVHPELEAAEQPVSDTFLACVRALCDGDEALCDDLATAAEAAAHGHAMLLLYGDFGLGEQAIEDAANLAGRATRALVDGRHRLSQSSPA